MGLDDGQQKRRKSPLGLMIVVGGILVVEAVVIIGAMMILGGPADVEAADVPAVLTTPEDERIVEILVIDAKLPNNKSGMTYLYDTEIYVQVKKRYSDPVAEELQQFRNEIKSEITAIRVNSEQPGARKALNGNDSGLPRRDAVGLTWLLQT